ncbi:MAG: histidine kinase [Cytophagaceae bacterium]|nr:histidine kinase [Cytophagaceae bacterium]
MQIFTAEVGIVAAATGPLPLLTIFTDEVGIVAAATGLLLLLTIFTTFFLLIQQQRYYRYRRELAAMKAAYESELLRSQLEMQEQTMQAVGREIHDNVGQILSLVKINLSTLPAMSDPNTNERLINTREYLNRAIADLRGLSKSLNAENRLAAGLCLAIRAEMEGIHKTGVVETTFESQGTERRLDPRQELILFRITQELLNNALKHAEAKNLHVLLDYSIERLTLSIKDNGVGFEFINADSHVIDKQDKERGSGLLNIQNRAKLIGADLDIRSIIGQGTTAILVLPFELPHS